MAPRISPPYYMIVMRYANGFKAVDALPRDERVAMRAVIKQWLTENIPKNRFTLRETAQRVLDDAPPAMRQYLDVAECSDLGFW